jgi:hypothetical protein
VIAHLGPVPVEELLALGLGGGGLAVAATWLRAGRPWRRRRAAVEGDSAEPTTVR